MRICVISSVDFKEPYGSTVRPYNISKSLASLGCQILHVCTNPPEDYEEESISYVLKRDHKASIIYRVKDFFRVYEECKEFNPEVFYAQQLSNAIRALPLSFLFKVPLVYDEHGSYLMSRDFNEKQILLEKICTKLSSSIIVPTEETRKVFVELHGIPSEKVKVVEDGVNTSKFELNKNDSHIRRKLGIAEESKIIVFTCPRAGRSNFMALNYFFGILPEIEERIANIKFLIIGGGPQIDPPSNNVIYTGFVQDLAPYVDLGDICIAPYPSSSICGTSGGKNKVMEYYACGKPVISTSEGIRGFRHTVPNRDFLLATDSNNFVDKVLFLLGDNKTSKKLSKNAIKLSIRYDWTLLSKKVLAILKSVTKN